MTRRSNPEPEDEVRDRVASTTAQIDSHEFSEPGLAAGWDPAFLPAGLTAAAVRRLPGGVAHVTWLVELVDGARVVVKGGGAGVPSGLFAVEAAGLAVLRETGGLPTPEVVAVGDVALVLRALNPELPEDDGYWEAAGRAVAGLHGHGSDRYGWEDDGWLGLLPQRNAWDSDGHRFFAEQRILRYLGEPKVEQALDAADRAGLERLCVRLPELLPAAPAVLTHGDMWRANLIAGLDGSPVFIDPAVCWMWAETDVSMMFCTGGVPERFFAAYHEIRPAEGDWRARMELLNLRERLCMLAHFGPVPDQVERIREVVARLR